MQQFFTFKKLLPDLTLTEINNLIVFPRMTNQLISSSLQRHKTVTDAVTQKTDPHFVCLVVLLSLTVLSIRGKKKKEKRTC